MGFRSITVKKALEHISRNDFVLPAIQREFVWSPEQIGRLFDSLIRQYPIGTFLFWQVPPELSRSFRFYGFMREYHEVKSRHSPPVHVTEARGVTAILDGQQRLTALNIGLLGYLATRRKYGRVNNASSYPSRYLYLDVQHSPVEGDDESTYRFAFLTETDASSSTTGATWFRVGDILDLQEGSGIFRWVQHHGLAEHPTAFETLDRLWRAVHVREVISFFEDDSSSIDRVLEIFIRTNSGGTVLSKSDLLLSVATAQFVNLDAREAVHGLVDDLNAVGQGFDFTKDNVLKAGLMITDRPQLQFKVDAFTAENVAVLEARWDEIDQALRVSAQLLASFGFSARTLSAGSVILPIADYVAHRRLGPDYITGPAHRHDRERLRRWVIRSLLKQGTWGSGLDTLLMRLRRAIRSSWDGFPEEDIEQEMSNLGKSLVMSPGEIEELAEVQITNRRAFPLLALLYPGVDTRYEFHLDHIFPRSLFTEAKLTRAGVEGDLHDEYKDLRDRLPNLQLLEGSINVSKQAALPADWAATHIPDPTARGGWLAAHDMAHLPDDMVGFLDFYDRRRDLMAHRLTQLLSSNGEVGPGATEPSTLPDRGLAAAAPGVPGFGHATSAPAPAPNVPGFPAPMDPVPPAAPANPPPPYDQPASAAFASGSTPSWGRTQRPKRGGKRSFRRSLSDLPNREIIYRYRGVDHRAMVEDGTIRLSNGDVFTSPSSAALAVNGGISVNGWRVWKMDGEMIADIIDRRR